MRASNFSPILTMSRALQIVTYIVTWSSFLTAIATCLLRIYCCRSVKRRWKADDFMSLAVGVSTRPELYFEDVQTKMIARCSLLEHWVSGNERS